MFVRVYWVVFLYAWVYLLVFWVRWLTECDIITLCLQVKEQNHLETRSSGSRLSHLPCEVSPSVHTINLLDQCHQPLKSSAAPAIHSVCHSCALLLNAPGTAHCTFRNQAARNYFSLLTLDNPILFHNPTLHPVPWPHSPPLSAHGHLLLESRGQHYTGVEWFGPV